MTWANGRPNYGSAWVRLRYQVLADEPTCRACGQAPATEVDHIKPKSIGGTDDRSNLQALCSPCHRSKTGRDAHPNVRPREPHPGLRRGAR